MTSIVANSQNTTFPTGAINSINVSDGGVPKLPVTSARVTKKGIEGDSQAKPGVHGGIYRAVSLFSLEIIQALAEQGHPIRPGSTGENITLSGELWNVVAPGTLLKLGNTVQVKITSYATPCPTIANSFSDGNVIRMHHRQDIRLSRLYVQVMQEGIIASGDKVEIIADYSL